MVLNTDLGHKVNRILLISDFAHSKSVSAGTERLVFGIAEWFTNKYGIKTDILTPNWNNEKDIEEINGVTIHRFKTHDIYHHNAKKRIYDYIKAGMKLDKYDLYHGFYTMPPIMATISLAKLKSSKSIISIFSRPQLEMNLKNPIYSRILLKFLKHANVITTTFWSVGNYLRQEYFSPNKLITVPCWVEDHFFKQLPAKKRDKKIILFVGRMVKEKGVFVLLNAFANIKDRVSSKLVLVGPPYEKDVVKRTIKQLNIEKDVDLVGYVSEKELLRWYNSADIIAAPTIGKDTFTWTLMEAMACGKPIISTETLQTPIDTGGLGVVVKSGDVKSLEDGMLELLLDKRFCLECGKNSRLAAKKLFDKKTVMAEYLNLYECTVTVIP